MATNRVLQLLRSTQIYADFSTAKDAIETITGKKDGEIVLARYISGSKTSNGEIVNTYETAIGVYSNVTHSSNTMDRWTVFKSSTELQDALDALQAELDRTQAGAGLGTDGTYTAPTSGQSGFEILGGNGAPTNIKDAVMKLADEIAAMDYTNNYTAATTGNDPVPAHATDASKVISGVNQENGVLDTVTTDAVDLLLTGYQNTNASGAIAGTDTLENALSKLENATSTGVQVSAKADNQLTRITGDSTAANNGLYSHVEIAQLTAQEVTALSDANVREAYKLINPTDRTAIGDVIKIYKDSALTGVYVGHMDDRFSNPISGETTITDSYTNKETDITDGSGSEALCFVYHKADGNYELVAVNVESFLQESEFGDGLQVNNHLVSVKKDTSSEQVYTAASTQSDVLTVSSSGVKVANVQAAINYASSVVLNTTVTKADERGVGGQNTTPHIGIATTTVDGITRYSLTETDIASEDELDAEVTRAKAAEAAIDSAVGLTKDANAETRSYTSQLTQRGSETLPTTVAGDIDLLDSRLEALNGAAVKSVTSGDNAIAVDNNDDQNPVVTLTLDDSTVGTGSETTPANGNNALTITNDGLFLSTIWDCGTYDY